MADWTLGEWLSYIGPVALVALTLGLRKFRLFVLKVKAQKAESEKKANLDLYYERLGVKPSDVDAAVGNAILAAHKQLKETGIPVLLTIYDPGDKPDGQLTKLESCVGAVSDIVIRDFRLTHEDLSNIRLKDPKFVEKCLAKTKERRDAIALAALYEDKTDAREVESTIIAKAKLESVKIAEEANAALEALLPEIRAQAEEIARVHFVPPRMETFEAESKETGVPVQTIVDAFVTACGDNAAAQAKERMTKPGELDAEKNDLLKRATLERVFRRKK